jgi:hypothetical protein
MSESSETPCPETPRRRTQFKPGQSGNPLGRPKRKVDMSVALNKALNDNILVTNLGKTRTGLEAVVQSIVDRVLQGDSKGIALRRRRTCGTASWAFRKVITRSETAGDFG